MSIFAIGDLHLSFSSNKPMNIFGGWKDYVKRLEENWCRLISDTDTIVIPGDVSWGMSLMESLEDFRFIDRLPGMKIIAKGNHDYWWNTVKKIKVFFEQNQIQTISIMNNNAFLCEGYALCGTRGWYFADSPYYEKKIANREVQRMELSLKESVKLNCEPIVFLHFPPVYGSKPLIDEDMTALFQKYGVRNCYYGHLHGHAIRSAFNGIYRGIRYQLISSDFLGFCPYKIGSS